LPGGKGADSPVRARILAPVKNIYERQYSGAGGKGADSPVRARILAPVKNIYERQYIGAGGKGAEPAAVSSSVTLVCGIQVKC